MPRRPSWRRPRPGTASNPAARSGSQPGRGRPPPLPRQTRDAAGRTCRSPIPLRTEIPSNSPCYAARPTYNVMAAVASAARGRHQRDQFGSETGSRWSSGLLFKRWCAQDPVEIARFVRPLLCDLLGRIWAKAGMNQPAANAASPGPVSAVTATAIVIADMVGIGVFTSLGFQVGDITSGFALLLL